MANLEELAAEIRNNGYSEINSEAKVCQDIVLKAISQGDLCRNITVKGGVVMRSITGDSFKSKIDFGVHKNVQIEQDEYCFDVCLDDVGASLLINSK